MTDFQLAQINIGTFKAPVESPLIAEFIANLDRINALADISPGFVWRLTGNGNDAIDIQPFENPLIGINMSVWTGTDALAVFVYRSAHRDIMRRRHEWFEKMELFTCLWWVPAGHKPTPEEGIGRLDLLRRCGPTPDAFTFRDPFGPPDDMQLIEPILDECA